MRLFSSLHQASFSIAPGLCLLCNQATSRRFDLCTCCEIELPQLTQGCYYCAEPLTDSGTCARCMSDAPAFSKVLCAFEYAHPVDHLIQEFKDKGHRAAGFVLTQLAIKHLASQLQAIPHRDLLLTSVPLHPARIRKRGFNQAELIAGWLAEATGIEPNHKLLNRNRDTGSQRSLKLVERQRNLSQAFQVSEPAEVKNRTLLLVDDVVTTTSTVREVSYCLMEAGAADVIVLALARTRSGRTSSL
jgi:ComF family protein